MSDRKNSPPSQDDAPPREMWRLLKLCAAEPRAWDFIRDSIESDAQRIAAEDFAHDQGRGISWQPSWLPRIAREILRALKPSK